MPTLDELLAGLSYNELVVFYDRHAGRQRIDTRRPSALSWEPA
jgi:hypothetical protein